jgi:hypothetical protein
MGAVIQEARKAIAGPQTSLPFAFSSFSGYTGALLAFSVLGIPIDSSLASPR